MNRYILILPYKGNNFYRWLTFVITPSYTIIGNSAQFIALSVTFFIMLFKSLFSFIAFKLPVSSNSGWGEWGTVITDCDRQLCLL